MDIRNQDLAHNLVNYSCSVKPGEKVYVHFTGKDTVDLAKQIVREVYKAGGTPYPHYTEPKVLREMLLSCTEEQLSLMAKMDAAEMREMDCYIAIRGGDNIYETSDVPSEKLSMYSRLYTTPVHHAVRVPLTRWVVLRYPSDSMAQSAGISTEAFEDFYYKVCNLDYSKMGKAMDSLVEVLNHTDQVHIAGPGTDLSFSIKDIPAVKCAGRSNIPDGEVYTAPVRDSINGVLTYNAPSVYQGTVYNNICLTFENGKIINATADGEDEKINQVFDTDEGARYVGEFAIGVNPYIETPMRDTLFDEKIKGSFHFTPGNCYDEAPNGNHSAIHWDLVCIQTEAYGGGEIYFDGKLIRKDGIFVTEELKCLNPENLI